MTHFRSAEKMAGKIMGEANKSVDESAKFLRHQRIIIHAPQTNFVARRKVLFKKNHLSSA
jgi:hypothetical protein